jgi:hypothetical protein
MMFSEMTPEFSKQFKKKISGRKAKRYGAEFEQYIINVGHSQDIKVIRINDGCKRVGPQRLIPMKQPFDFVLISTGDAVFCDTKSTTESRFAYSRIDYDQLMHLSDCEEKGCRAGYLVMFHETKDLRFFDAYQLRNLQPGHSLGPDEGTNCGTTYTPNLKVLFSSLRELEEPLTGDTAV